MGFVIMGAIGVATLICVMYCRIRVNKQGDTLHQKMMKEKRKEIYQASIEHPALLMIENGWRM